jgi:trans-aconitate 2-methyltransferase
MTSSWDPDQYRKFAGERAQPFYDLLALCRPVPGGRAIDLGCGPGELTRVLHETVQAKATVGLDNSETMLAAAAAHAGRGLTFKLGTILRFAPTKPFDLVFSNAALQWVPDHAKLFPRLWAGVAPGGQFAVQMPANHDHPSHTEAHALAAEEPFRTWLGGYVRQVPVVAPEWYAALIDDLGASGLHVRLQVYAHHLAERDAVVEWVKGTLLTDYQTRLTPEQYAAFLAAYRERLAAALPERRPHFYPFKRILIWALKG